jgi:hypothetical protein
LGEELQKRSPNAPRASRTDTPANPDPKIMTDAELRPFFNEVMRRKMKLRRQKEQT